MKIAWDPNYILPLPPGHRFPMEKYDLIPRQLLHEGTIEESNFFTPEPMEDEVLLAAHTPEYIDKIRRGEMTYHEMRRIGFPWSREMVEREECIMFGTVQAALYALEDGVAFNIAGGTHHAYADHGEGFCIFNDIAVGALYLLAQEKANKILVADLDVHQGNGTAAIFRGHPDVFTFSMHGQNNYPLHKEESDLDIGLNDRTTDTEYLDILSETLPRLINEQRPDFIFYQSGVDILSTDKMGRMSLTREGCRERDRIVLEQAYRHGIPLTAVMGGGYSPDIRDIVEAHCNLYRLAAGIYT